MGVLRLSSINPPSGTPGKLYGCMITSELASLAARDCLTSSSSVVLLLSWVEMSGAAAFVTVKRDGRTACKEACEPRHAAAANAVRLGQGEVWPRPSLGRPPLTGTALCCRYPVRMLPIVRADLA